MPELQTQQNLGRAKNAIQDYLIRKLLYPKVYLDAEWNGVHIDLLAIDRTGVGDVHAVRIAPVRFEDGPANWQEHVTKAAIIVNENSEELLALPGHFRYVALFNESADLHRFDPTVALVQKLTATDGVGRIGILVVDFSYEEPVLVILKPERFKSSKQIIELTDSFVAANQANWELRE
ncbi:MAG: hypothetical protein ACLQHF_00345 [Terracidiphilus sp.]